MSAASPAVVDEVARRLAAQAGLVWATLSNHPGYHKHVFREQARELLAAAGQRAARDEQREARLPG